MVTMVMITMTVMVVAVVFEIVLVAAIVNGGGGSDDDEEETVGDGNQSNTNEQNLPRAAWVGGSVGAGTNVEVRTACVCGTAYQLSVTKDKRTERQTIRIH